jgi:hypothetical protein
MTLPALDMEAINRDTLSAQLEALRADRDRLHAELAAARAENRALLARIDPRGRAAAAGSRDLRVDAPPAGPLTWAEYDRR